MRSLMAPSRSASDLAQSETRRLVMGRSPGRAAVTALAALTTPSAAASSWRAESHFLTFRLRGGCCSGIPIPGRGTRGRAGTWPFPGWPPIKNIFENCRPEGNKIKEIALFRHATLRGRAV